jgi:chromosome segregation ATPase
MTSLTALEARTTSLEYAVFEQFPHTLNAMRDAAGQVYAVAVANGEAIAGLRVDMAAVQTSVHREMTDFKTALDLQGDALRKELGVATVEFRTSLTGVREEMGIRFQKVDGQFNAVNGDIANLQTDVTAIRQDVAFLKDDFAFLKEEVDTVKTDVTTLKTDVTAFKGDVTRRFDAVDQRFDTLDNKIDVLIAAIRNGKS